MTLTVTEREHWKERIAKRIDKAIVATYSEKDPTLLQRIETEAKRQAAAALGLETLLDERKRLLDEKDRLAREVAKTCKRLIVLVTGRPDYDVELSYYDQRNLPREVAEAVEEAAASVEERLLAEDPLGKRVLELRLEKEELLDTVWLATSGKEIKELWTRVSDRLEQQPTPLQADALRIEPDQSDS